MSLAATFKNNDWETSFNELGYIHVPGFLPPHDVEALLALYRQHHVTVKEGQNQWNSLYDVGQEKGHEISALIKARLDSLLEATFLEWEFPVATFMAKNPMKESTCEVHRDFTTFDEERFQFRNIWIPLVDITPQNGALYVVPKSHTLFQDIRPMFAEWPYKHLENELRKYFRVLYPKAGDLVVYADKTLHGSLENQTLHTRPVLHGGILHREAESHYYQLQGDELNVYRVPFEFYFSGAFHQADLAQNYHLVKSLKYIPQNIRVEDLEAYL